MKFTALMVLFCSHILVDANYIQNVTMLPYLEDTLSQDTFFI